MPPASKIDVAMKRNTKQPASGTLPPTLLSQVTTLESKPVDTSLEEEDLDEDFDDEEEEDDDDDEGSLVDFIVKDKDEHSEDETADDSGDEEEEPLTAEESMRRDMEGIDTSNIVTGKRTRKATKFYENQLFQSEEYRRMMLCDVPDDEMHALEESDDEDDNGSEADGSYAGNATESSEDESCVSPKSKKKRA